MPTFEVFEERSQSLKVTGTDDSIKTVWNKDYIVQVTLSGTETLASIDAYDVMTASGLPTVNRSIYEVNGNIMPFVVCRSKTQPKPALIKGTSVKTAPVDTGCAISRALNIITK